MRWVLLQLTHEEQRHREVRQLVQQHTAGKQQREDGSQSHLFTPEHGLMQ